MEKEKEIQIVVSIVGVFFCQRYLFFVTHFSFRDKPLDLPLSRSPPPSPNNPNPIIPSKNPGIYGTRKRLEYRVHSFLSLIN